MSVNWNARACIVKTGMALAAIIVSLGVMTTADARKPKFRMQEFREAPATDEGRRCLNQCDTTRLQCEANAAGNYDRCQIDRQNREQACEREAQNTRNYCLRNNAPSCDLQYSNTLNSCRMYIRDCRVETAQCDQMSNQCFQNCGGRIWREEVCVKNCDLILPPQAYAVCKEGNDVSIAKTLPDGKPLRNKFCDEEFCSSSGVVVKGPDKKGRCLISPELQPAKRDWVPYQILSSE
ncbi:MAG: hypothetical protein KDA46_13965 [Parvularculaceae bacterium]|nr:hypothetical protein [Parvularculaceae bacterium]